MELSVLIPAHNPRQDSLRRVFDALRGQSVGPRRWELLVVDNASDVPLRGWLDLSWHPHATIVREGQLGVTLARARGFRETTGEVIVVVDDDNVLDGDYLEQVLKVGGMYPHLGSWSGAVLPEFEAGSFHLDGELSHLLTLRDVRKDVWSNDPAHNASTPWGAGLCLRRAVARAYLAELSRNPSRTQLDLKGSRLLYGGDTDIAFAGCRAGFGKGVFACLRLTHLISAERCSLSHLCKVSRGRGYSEVLHHFLDSGLVSASEPVGIRRVWDYARLVLRPRWQRSVALAHLSGQRQATREMAARAAP